MTRDGSVLVPCRNCGADVIDGEETTATVEVTAEPVFAGKRGEAEVAARICPECGEVTPL